MIIYVSQKHKKNLMSYALMKKNP